LGTAGLRTYYSVAHANAVLQMYFWRCVQSALQHQVWMPQGVGDHTVKSSTRTGGLLLRILPSILHSSLSRHVLRPL
jgi:hypothetical protein